METQTEFWASGVLLLEQVKIPDENFYYARLYSKQPRAVVAFPTTSGSSSQNRTSSSPIDLATLRRPPCCFLASVFFFFPPFCFVLNNPNFSLLVSGRFRKQEAWWEAMSNPKRKEKEVMEPWGEGCAACRHLQCACGPECVFALHFPGGDDPWRTPGFGALILICGLSPEQWAEAVDRSVRKAQQPEAAAAAVGPAAPPESRPPAVRGVQASPSDVRAELLVPAVLPPPDYDQERFAKAYAVFEAIESVLVHGVATNVLEMLEKKLARGRGAGALHVNGEALRHCIRSPEPVREMTDQEGDDDLLRILKKQLTCYLKLFDSSVSVCSITQEEFPLFVRPLTDKIMLKSVQDLKAQYYYS